MSNYEPLDAMETRHEEISMSEFRPSQDESTRNHEHEQDEETRHSQHSLEPKKPSTRMFSHDSYSMRSLLKGDQQPGVRPVPVKGPQSLFKTWWKEGLACLLVVAAAAAIIGTLYPYQGQPLPQWPYAITVNALLSAYMVVLKAAATFLLAEGIAHQKWKWFDEEARPLYDLSLHDDATRGPLGAVMLMWRVSFKHVWHLLGCLMILLALFVDPFTQQVLHYADCNVPDQFGAASIPRSNIFTGNGSHVAAGFDSITSAEQAALQAGIVAPSGQVDYQCTSGNCTFAPFGTIGYCSSCTDVSSQITVQAKNLTENGKVTTYPGVNTSIPGLSNYFVLDGGTSNFSSFGVADDTTRQEPGSVTYQFLVGVPFVGTDLKLGPYDPSGGLNPLNCNNAATNNTWRCNAAGAANCTLYPCVKTYNTTVTNGTLYEHLIAESPSFSQTFGHGESSPHMSTINATCLLPSEKDFLTKTMNYTISPDQSWIPYNLSGQIDSKEKIQAWVSNSSQLNDFEHNIQSRGCLYAISQTFYWSLPASYTTDAWKGDLIGYRNPYGGIARFGGPQILQTLYNFGDFSFDRTQSVFKNISESLTRHMRQNPVSWAWNATTDAYNFTKAREGEVTVDKTCLVVEWKWLTLPAVLVFFTLVFFAGTMIARGGVTDEVRTWKSSVLPLIFSGPNGGFGGGRNGELQDMEQLARLMDVKLVRGEDGGMYLREWNREGAYPS